MAFKLKPSIVKLTNLNPRPQAGSDSEERDLAIDIDVEFLAEKTILDGLLVKPLPMIAALWTSRGNVSEITVGKVALRNQFDGAHVKISYHDREVALSQCHLGKFSFTALDAHKCKLHFQIQCIPDDEQYLSVGRALKYTEVTLEVGGRQRVTGPAQEKLDV